MTKAEVMARLATVKDIEIDEREDEISVTVQDFDGFDEEGNEFFREYDQTSVEEMEDWLEEHCESYDGDYYIEYNFTDCVVCVGYTSFDI